MDPVETHYASPDLVNRIRAGLETAGKDLTTLTPRDLAPVDQLHTGGAPATLDLMAQWKAAMPQAPTILDAGCGTGGSARLLAEQFNARVFGIDLSRDFIDTAVTLTQWCGLEDRIQFRQGSILDLPYPDLSFDAVLCQHILMNIEDKALALAEFFRVLKPGGSLILHDITRGDGPDPLMPVPWATTPATSFLVPWETLADLITAAGFSTVYQSDDTGAAALWWQKNNARKKAGGPPPPLHPGLVFGKNARFFGANMEANFISRSVCCMAAILNKPVS